MINDSNDNIDHVILLNTQLNCSNNLSKIMNLILKNFDMENYLMKKEIKYFLHIKN